MTQLHVEPLLIWWTATFDRGNGPIGIGPTKEEAKANLIAQIAHADPHDLRSALGELATPTEILGAVKHIRRMIYELERDATALGPFAARYKHQRLCNAAHHWRRVINNLGRIAGVQS